MQFQRRELRKFISIRDVLSEISLRGILIAATLGVVVVASLYLLIANETLSTIILMFCMAAFASIATWGLANQAIQSRNSQDNSSKCDVDHQRITSIVRSGHSRIRTVTSSVASQINNSLMVMMSSLELIERNNSNVAHKQDFASLRRGMNDAEKLAQRLLRMSIPAAKKYSAQLPELPLQTVKGFKVLLVEDDPQVRTIIREMITPLNYTVQEAESLKEGFECLDEEDCEIHFAVIDIMLSDGSGLILAEQIRMRFPETPVLLITGGGYLEVGVSLRSDPRVSILQKPFTPEEFENQINQLLKVTDCFFVNT